MTALLLHVLALSLALASEGPAPAVGPAAPTGARVPPAPSAPRDPDTPPPGPKADQALWKVAYDLNNDLVVEQHVAARLTQGARGSGYLERLPELAKTGVLPKARADELAARLLQAWTANLEIVQRPWPVSKVRACGYELLNFESIMVDGRGMAGPLADARKTLEECLDRARLALHPLKRSNEELQAVLTEIERVLASGSANPEAPAPAKAG
jgi:hypothetical protein